MQVGEKRTIGSVLDGYACHLRDTCGLSEKTIRERLRYTRNFLRARFGTAPVEPAALSAIDVLRFIGDVAGRWKPATTKCAASSLRSFLRFLVLKGLVGEGLVSAVPTVPVRRLTDLPTSLSDEELKRLLDSFDRSTPTGLRDYAMAMCMARLGLRADDVSHLSLDEIDWRAGVIRFPSKKTRRTSLLPLTQEVGQAIVAYLRRRPADGTTRSVFVRHRKPLGGRISGKTIGSAIRSGLKRAGVQTSPHALRHTAATQMLQKGATLKEIADVLRHRSIDTTAIYAKVDVQKLAEVAMPWPGTATFQANEPPLGLSWPEVH
ncbi:site-specific integrase [Planctomycetota bacterium]